jgi:3-dehydroquinate synthase
LDKGFLRTLPPLEISSGLGEILKMAVVKDGRLFDLLERDGRQLLDQKFIGCPSADEVINRAVLGMKVELENNLWETDLKRLVDFGHSFSPIIEMRSIHHEGHAPLTHGQAVALDVMFSCLIAHGRGMLGVGDVERVFRTARAMQLPTNHTLFNEPLVILEALKDTMKHRNGAQNLPMPLRIGESTFLNDVSYDDIKAVAVRMKAINIELFGDDRGVDG